MSNSITIQTAPGNSPASMPVIPGQTYSVNGPLSATAGDLYPILINASAYGMGTLNTSGGFGTFTNPSARIGFINGTYYTYVIDNTGTPYVYTLNVPIVNSTSGGNGNTSTSGGIPITTPGIINSVGFGGGTAQSSPFSLKLTTTEIVGIIVIVVVIIGVAFAVHKRRK